MGLEAAAFAAMSATSLYGAFNQSAAQEAQGDYQRRAYNTNAELSEMRAQDAEKRGLKEANAYGQKVKGVVGSQRAAFAAQGVDVDSGSAADIQAETRAIGAQDTLRIKNNAWREAWGFRMDAAQGRATGDMAQRSGSNSARTTLMTGGLEAAGYGLRAWKGKV